MSDRLREGIVGLIEGVTRGAKFMRHVRARVVNVLASGYVETQPEAAGTPPLPPLPLRYGLPGVLRAVVESGAHVLVGWADGDPAQPYVASWDPSKLVELVFDVPGGARPLARDDDTVDVGTIRVTAMNIPGGGGATLTFIYTPPVGAPTTVAIGFPAPVAVAPEIPPPGTPINLVGKIEATSVVKA